MTVRPLQASDFAKLAALLRLHDARSEYRTMAPESRDEQGLALELGDESPYSDLLPLVLDDGDSIRAYVGGLQLQRRGVHRRPGARRGAGAR